MTVLLAGALAGVSGAAPPASIPEELTPGGAPLLGFQLDPAGTIELPSVALDSTARRPLVRLVARWEQVERIPGAYDWTTIGPAIDSALYAGYRPVLALAGSHPHYLPDGGAPSPLVGRSTDAWLEFVRSAARNFVGRVAVFEVGEGGPQADDEDARVQALVLKQSALAIRAEARARGVDVWLAQGALPPDALDWQKALWSRELAAYYDILPVFVEVASDLDARASRFREVYEQSLLQAPAPALWAYVREPSDSWDAPSLAVLALTVGASAAVFDPSGPEQVRWTLGLQGTLNAGYVPAALGALRLESAGAADPAGGRVLGRFFHEQDFTTLVVYQAPATAATTRLIVDSTVVRNARLLDPSTGRTRRVRSTAVAEGRALRVDSAAAPGAALFQRQAATPGFDLPAEELEVATERGLTAEEIIAHYQLLQRDQDDRLERWTAQGRIDFHFKLAQGGTGVDVSIDCRYFWERGGQLEWEQTNYYVNGNRVRWKNIPELPLIQPEKVITLPLDLTLDKTYTYRLVGSNRVRGRETYVVEFEPTVPDPDRSLYRGRLWIDTTTFARLKASVIQDKLQAPVLSNEEIDRYELVVGPDGQPYWMFSHIDGQQIWNAVGRTFVVRRELTFSEFEINPPRGDFEERRRQAYTSDNQMLRDTDNGFRYLERQADGSRTVKEGEDSSQFFAAVGAFKDSSQDNVVPLGGVNYFDYDLGGFQVNALFAGVFGIFTASKPDLFGRKMDLTADLALNALKFDDKVFAGDDELVALRIESRSQLLAIRLGLPAGQFVKFSLIGGLSFRQYFDSDDGQSALMDLVPQSDFVLPEDHWQVSGTLQAEFNRRGYSLTGAISRASRSDWEAWGLRNAGGFVNPEPVRDEFTHWSVRGAKEWYLPKFQKVRAAIDYLNGSELDRFSRYSFSFFGNDRLNGFSGSGVRFDEALIVRGGYSFNLFEVLRFDAALEAARVEELDVSQDFSGIGLSANLVGPWKTIINLNYGYALQSDIPDLEGEQEFLLFVFKLF